MRLLLGAMLGASVVHADVVPAVSVAMAFRGGALALPLVPTGNLPAKATVRLINQPDGGITDIEAQIAWYRPTPPVERHWTVPAMPLVVSLDGPPGTPHLVVPLPEIEHASLQVGRAVVNLRWHDLPEAMPVLALSGRIDGVLEVDPGALDMPSRESPFQAWRLEIIAARRGLEPPPLSRFERTVDRRIALQSVGAWRLAMGRLHASSPGVARLCAELLTGTARSARGTLAAWITDRSAEGELLEILLGQAIGDPPDRVAQTLAWCERQAPVMAWITHANGETVTVSLANAQPTQVLVELVWAVANELPLAEHLPGNWMMEVQVDPLPLRGDARLVIEVDRQLLVLPVRRTALSAVPPGLLAGPLLMPLILEDVRAGVTSPPPAVDRQTFAQLRRLGGSWELMIEARWPEDPGVPGTQGIEPHGVRGTEAVVVAIVSTGAGQQVFTVTPDGLTGANGEGPRPEAHARRLDHAWLCRVVLPDGWMEDEEIRMALLRAHAGDFAVETWPTPGGPWQTNLDPAVILLGDWDQGLLTD